MSRRLRLVEADADAVQSADDVEIVAGHRVEEDGDDLFPIVSADARKAPGSILNHRIEVANRGLVDLLQVLGDVFDIGRVGGGADDPDRWETDKRSDQFRMSAV